MLRPTAAAAHFDPSGTGGATPARSNMKPYEVLYKPSDAAVRVARVRNVLFTHELDALLFIAGADSKDNPGCMKAINYIISGAYGNVLATPMLCDDALEETVVLVYKGGIRVYTTPAACEAVTAILSGCPGLEVYSLDERHFKNQDFFEDHKIATYQKMIKGFKKVGFALPQTVADMVRDQVVEKWPLIQAHALDRESGQRTFFTREHEVKDVTNDLECAYRPIGSHELSSMMLTQAPLLQRHWEDTLLFVGHSIATGKVSAEIPPHEPLVSYFGHGTMRRAGVVRTWGVIAPQFLSGDKTNARKLEECPIEKQAEIDAKSVHCTLEASDPQAPLFAARTYTLSSGCLPALDAFGKSSLFTMGAIPPDARRHRPQSVRRVNELYTVLGHTFEELVEELRQGKGFGSGREREKFASRTFSRVAELLGVETATGVGALTVSLTQHDFGAYGSQGAATAGTSECAVVYLRLHLAGVLAPEDGSLIGGLLYGDTLALSGPAPCEVLNLTRRIPQLGLLKTTPEEKSASDLLARALSRCKEAWESPDLGEEMRPRLVEGVPLGEYIGEMPEGAHVYLPCASFGCGGVLSSRIEMFANGLLLFTASGEALAPLLLADLPSIEVHTPIGLEESSYIALRRGEGRWSLPAAVGQELGAKGSPAEGRGDLVVICLQPRSPGKRWFAAEVLPRWKAKVVVAEEASPEFNRHPRIAEFTSDWQRSGSVDTSSFGNYRPFSYTPPAADPRPVEAARLRGELLKQLPQWAEFQAAFGVKEADHSLYNKLVDHTAPLQAPRRIGGPGVASDGELVVHVVSGYPGSGKHRLVQAVQRAISSAHGGGEAKKFKLGIVEYTAEDGYDVDGAGLYGRIRNAMGGGTGEGGVVLVSVPGAVPVAWVVHLLGQLGAERPVRLSSVTVVVHPDNFFLDSSRQVLPGMTGLLANGYVSQFLFHQGSRSETAAAVEALVRGVNTTARIVHQTPAALEGMGILGGPRGDVFDLGSEEAERARRCAVTHPLVEYRPMEPLELVQLKYDRLLTTKYRVTQFVQRLSEHVYNLNIPPILRCKALLHADGQGIQIRAVRGKPTLNRLEVVSKDPILRHNQELLFVGQGLELQALRDFVDTQLISDDSLLADPWESGATVQVADKLPLVTKDSLQQQEIEDINTANQHRRLPEGWSWDGVTYCYSDGDPRSRKTSRLRPDLDELIEEYIAERNVKRKQHNASIDAQTLAERPPDRVKAMEKPPTAAYFP